MFARLVSRLLRATPYDHGEPGEAQVAMTCHHGAGFGPRHWHAKGTVPGYKGAGYFRQCLSWCRACLPS